MPDILISESISGPAVDALGSKFNVEQLPDLWKDPKALAARANDCRALIVRNQTQVTQEVLAAAPRLIVIGRAGIGLDNIDVESASRAGVIVTYAPEQNAISVAEFCIGLMLSLARMIPQANRETKRGQWNRQSWVGTELYGKTLGIIGAGKIGCLTAKRAQGFGMKIVAYDPFVDPDSISFSELNGELVELDDLFGRADVVSCHVPVTPQTRELIDRNLLKRMKKSAFLINTSRGEVLHETDLVDALKNHTIAGAALDVRACEPPAANELEKLPNVILTPHIAAFTHEAQTRVVRAVCEDVSRVLEGKRAKNAVNGQVAREVGSESLD
jgi:D-3-phosphoglycerate dehydrogenase